MIVTRLQLEGYYGMKEEVLIIECVIDTQNCFNLWLIKLSQYFNPQQQFFDQNTSGGQERLHG
jgi:hypothetical protein